MARASDPINLLSFTIVVATAAIGVAFYLQRIDQGLKNEFRKLDQRLAAIEQGRVAGSRGTAHNPVITGHNSGEQSSTGEPYSFSQELPEGGGFLDPRTGAALGVTEINRTQLEGTVTLPNQDSQVVKNVGAGQSWRFRFKGRSYKLIVTKVSDDSYTFAAEVREEE